MPQPTHQGKPHSDLRLRENRDDSNHEEQEHLTKAGEPDHRYKENREGNKETGKHIEDDTVHLEDIPTKKDGTADMRYTESREAVSSGLIAKDEVIEGDDHQKDDQHRKHDGSKDKRYKENRDENDDDDDEE